MTGETAVVTTSEQLLRGELEAAFETHRRELHVHCYRMTGSLTDAEDLTQDVFVRAWRNVDRFDRRASLRTWLYRIATNACIDFLRSHQRRAQPTASLEETLEREGWIDPYPDRADPAERVVTTETTDLYLMAALGHLPARQRAALIARDLLELDARDAAAVLDCTPTAVNSLLQRAHQRLRDLGITVGRGPASTSDDDVIRTYIDAHQRGDVATIVSLLAADVRITMPPEPPCRGVAQAEHFFAQILGPEGPGVWELSYSRANGTHATVNSVREPGDDVARPLSIDVITTCSGKISAIHCFIAPAQVRTFIDLTAGERPLRGRRGSSDLS